MAPRRQRPPTAIKAIIGVERGGLEAAPVLLTEAAFSACEVGVGEEEERRIVGAGAPVKVEAGGRETCVAGAR